MRDEEWRRTGASCLRTWVERAERAFSDPAVSPERRVHLLRVTGKRLRSVVCLARSSRPAKKWPDRHLEAMQEEARVLGPYRDAAVASELLEKRERKLRGERMRELWQRWRTWCEEQSPVAKDPPPLLLTRLLLALEEAEERLRRWLVERASVAGLQRAWSTSVDDLRAEAEAFFADPTNDAAHLWRKRMKELWYQTEWLQAMEVAVPLTDVRPLDRLSAALGKANDFAVLQDWLWETEHGPWQAEERLLLDGHLETMKRKAWQRVGLNWPKVLATLDPPAPEGSAGGERETPLRLSRPVIIEGRFGQSAPPETPASEDPPRQPGSDAAGG